MCKMCIFNNPNIHYNDGNNNWDNNGEKNYTVSEGAYGIKNGVVTPITV